MISTNFVTRGVAVSTSALLACHQCLGADSSLGLGLNFLASICRIFVWGFLWVLQLLPPPPPPPPAPPPPPLHFIGQWFQTTEKKAKTKCDFNCVKLNSLAVPLYHVPHDMLHVISARCARDFHTIAPGSLERTCWRRFVAWQVRRLFKKSICGFECDCYCYYCSFILCQVLTLLR